MIDVLIINQYFEQLLFNKIKNERSCNRIFE